MATIYKIKRRSGVRYGVTYYLPDGTRVRKVIGPKWHEADEFRRTIEKEADEGRWEVLTAKEIAFSEFAKEYLESKKAKATAKTYKTNFYCIDRVLIPYFGRYHLHQISPAMLEKFIVESCTRSISPLTVNGYLRVLSAMLNQAIHLGYKARNIVSGEKKLKAPEKEARFLTQDEAAKLLAAVKYTRLSVVVALGLLAGVRKGELLNLKWSDIDFTNKFLKVVNRPDEGFQTKNYRNRSIGLHPELENTLLWWRHTYSARVSLHKSDKTDYVVTYKGKRVASSERALRQAYKKAGLPPTRPFHTLRHSFGAYLAMAGVSLYEIAKIMGHTFEQVTQLYAHLQPEHLHKQVGKIPQIAAKPGARK